MKNCLKAIKIYKHSLPSAHPNHALAQISLANVYLCKGEYNAALDQYHRAMRMLETALPSNHPDRARPLHNIGLAYERQGDLEKATNYFNQAANIAEQTLSAEHPLMTLINNSRDRISGLVKSCTTVCL